MVFEDDSTWIDQRIAAVEAQIIAYEEAILAIGTDGLQSYTLDTGQSRQTVTKANMSELRLALSNLENRRATLLVRRNGSGFHGRPSF